MQLPSIIQSFFFPKAPPSPLKKPIYQQTERIINIAYLVLLSLSVVGIISGVFLSLSFPLLGAGICLISLAVGSCLLVLFPLLPDIEKIIARREPKVSITTSSPLPTLMRYFKSIGLGKAAHQLSDKRRSFVQALLLVKASYPLLFIKLFNQKLLPVITDELLFTHNELFLVFRLSGSYNFSLKLWRDIRNCFHSRLIYIFATIPSLHSKTSYLASKRKSLVRA